MFEEKTNITSQTKSVLKEKTGIQTSAPVLNKKLLNQIQSLENEMGKDNVDYNDLERRLLEVCEEILPLSLIKYIRLLLNLKKKSESSR